MWKVMNKEMRMPALAAAACAAVILVASPVSATTVTSNVFHKKLLEQCTNKKGKIRGNCMSARAEEFRGYMAEATAANKECRESGTNCDYWAGAYVDRFGALPQ